MTNVLVQQTNALSQACDVLRAILQGDKAQVDCLVWLLASVVTDHTTAASGANEMPLHPKWA